MNAQIFGYLFLGLETVIFVRPKLWENKHMPLTSLVYWLWILYVSFHWFLWWGVAFLVLVIWSMRYKRPVNNTLVRVDAFLSIVLIGFYLILGK